jgi:hypothetical protein
LAIITLVLQAMMPFFLICISPTVCLPAAKALACFTAFFSKDQIYNMRLTNRCLGLYKLQ